MEYNKLVIYLVALGSWSVTMKFFFSLFNLQRNEISIGLSFASTFRKKMSWNIKIGSKLAKIQMYRGGHYPSRYLQQLETYIERL